MAKQTFTTGQVLTAAQVNALQTNDFNQTVSAKTASYILVAADKGTRIEFNTSGSVTCTVNTGLFDAGDTVYIQNTGAGVVTITAGTATVNTSATLAVNQYEGGVLYFVSASSAIWFEYASTATGDITGITTGATSGLTGGVTSGTADLKFNTTAKGGLLVGTGSGTVTELTVGSNNTVLTADSTTASGLKWAAASSGSMTLLSTTTLSTTTTTVSSISQSYKHLYIEILGIDTSNFNPTIVYGTNSNAVVFNVTQAAAATGVNYYNTGGTVGNAQNYGGSQPVNKAAIWLYDYTDATNRKVGSFNQYWINEGGAPIYFNGQFVTGHTAAMNAFYMTVSTGSYDAGTIKIYGVN